MINKQFILGVYFIFKEHTVLILKVSFNVGHAGRTGHSTNLNKAFRFLLLVASL